MKKVVVLLALFLMHPLHAMEKTTEIPLLRQLAAATIARNIIDWDGDSAAQVTKLAPQLDAQGMLQPLKDTLSTISAPSKPQRLPITQPICSFDQHGKIGVSLQREQRTTTITLLDLKTSATIHQLTTHNKLDKALISPDAQRLLLLKDLDERKVIQTWDTATRKYEALFALADLEDIELIDNTPYLQFKLKNEKYGYFTTPAALAASHSQSAYADITEVPINSLTRIKFIPANSISKPQCEHFYDTGIAVWPASLSIKILSQSSF